MEHHHLNMGILWGHGGQFERERDMIEIVLRLNFELKLS